MAGIPRQIPKKIVWKLVTPIVALCIVATVAGVFVIDHLIHRNIERNAASLAVTTVQQYRVLRTYYSEQVIRKVLQNSDLTVDLGHETSDTTIPLPASMIHDLSDLLSEEGVALNLYSPYPFPGNADRKLDDFAKRAWEALAIDHAATLSESLTVGGKTLLRIAISDTMNAAGCVACHNSHPLTPKNDWKIGDLRGVMEVTVDISEQVAQGGHMARLFALGLIVIGTLISAFVVLQANRIATPLQNVSRGLKQLSEGDLAPSAVTAAGADTRSGTYELHQLTEAYENFRNDLRKRLNSQQQEQARLEEVVAERTEALRESVAEAKRANAAKSDFLSSMSHELRTPLNSILGFGQLLETDTVTPLSDEHQDYVNQIVKSGRHLLDLVNQVLDLAKIESGVLAINIEDISPGDIVQACLRMTETMAKRKDIKVVNVCKGRVLPAVKADATRFRQVLLNLLSNAVKYNRDQGQVTFDVETTQDTIKFVVSDTGHGIPEDQEKHLFEPFQRLTHRTGHIEGTGIGLTITKDLVQAMNGDLGYTTVEGEGSSFWFTLPLVPAKESQNPPLTDQA